MPLEDIVSVSISANTTTPTRPGFGTIMIMAGLLPNGHPVVAEYASLTEMTDAGFTTSHPAYKCASKIASANPRPRKWKVGKRTLPPTQSVVLKCLSADEGDVYTITVNDTEVEYTVLAAATTTTVATAIAALINADPVAAASSSADEITVTATAGAGVLNDFRGWSTNFELTDETANPGIATDLAAVLAFDPDWYGLALDSNSEAEINAAAAWVESNKKLFAPNNSDAACEDNASTTDVMADLEAAAYGRTGALYSRAQLLSYSGAAWMAGRFAVDPGKATWKFKTLPGVTVDSITSGAQSAIKAKKGNSYVSVAGVNITQEGWTASGEFFDVVRGIDWLESEIKIRVFSALANSSKLPYTNAGIETIKSIVRGAIVDAGRAGLVDLARDIVVDAPRVSEVDSVTKAGRLLPNVTFKAYLAGAIHATEITGELSV